MQPLLLRYKMLDDVHKRKSKIAQNEKKTTWVFIYVYKIVQQIWKHFAGTFFLILKQKSGNISSHILGKFLTYWYLYAFIKIIIQ